ncbi:MAG: helix-turn-helix transcriptional regulator [Pseudonocardiales bacterium]|nr:helix-turn-helix transcriptional regulator [Pseudonocardiales bacterium]
MTLPVLLVLRAMLDEPAREMYGLEICKAADLPSGTIHPILARLEGWGWLESRWEDKPAGGKPRKRYYRFSPGGAERARAALEKARIPVPSPKLVTKPQLIPRTTGGA